MRADDDPADEPDLRPLYTRAANQSGGGAEPAGVSALRRDISADDEDDIGEIDISLFEEGAGGGGWLYTYNYISVCGVVLYNKVSSQVMCI